MNKRTKKIDQELLEKDLLSPKYKIRVVNDKRKYKRPKSNKRQWLEEKEYEGSD